MHFNLDILKYFILIYIIKMRTIKYLIFLALSFSAINCDWLDNDFPPGVPVTISNPMFFGITEKCTVSSTDASDLLVATMNKGTGALNGNDVGAGLNVTVSNGDTLTIGASGYASVTITNHGNSLVHSHCTLTRNDMKIYQKAYEKVNDLLENGYKIGSYDFTPNTSVKINNPLLWTVKASCKVVTKDAKDDMNASMLKGNGWLNGNSVGAKYVLTIKNGDSFTIQASSLASVNIVNGGASSVHADCQLKSSSIRELFLAKGFLEKYYN